MLTEEISVFDIVAILRQQAIEIANEGHFGWGNTMIAAADEITRIRNEYKERAASVPRKE